LILLTLGTLDDLDLADLDLDDLLAFVLLVFRLFKYRAVTSPEADIALTLPLPADLEDFSALILGTFDDFPLILLAFLILIDLLVTFKLFVDLTLPEEYTEERDNNAITIKAIMDVYLLNILILCFYSADCV
jgi:hypothetical protein